MSEQQQAFHNKQEVKDLAISIAQHHIDADMLVKGDSALCTIGCQSESLGLPKYDHAGIAEKYNLPVQLMWWMDRLFENLPEPENKYVAVKIYSAIDVGQDLSTLFDRLAIKRNNRLLKLKPVQDNAQVKAAIEQCIQAHQAAISGDRSKLADAAHAAAAAYAAYAANAAAYAAYAA